jgi:hypothetical protein
LAAHGAHEQRKHFKFETQVIQTITA